MYYGEEFKEEKDNDFYWQEFKSLLCNSVGFILHHIAIAALHRDSAIALNLQVQVVWKIHSNPTSLSESLLLVQEMSGTAQNLIVDITIPLCF